MSFDWGLALSYLCFVKSAQLISGGHCVFYKSILLNLLNIINYFFIFIYLISFKIT